MSELIKLSNVDVHWPKNPTPILSQISFSVQSGRHYAFLGPNGAGKSTLLRLLAGEILATRGQIRWAGDTGLETSRMIAHKIVKLVSPALQETWQRRGWNINGMQMLASAREMTPFIQSEADPEMEKAAWELLEELGSPELADMFQPAMSQGQLRLLLLARAILAKPKVLLLDEYLDGIDSVHGKRLALLLDRISNFTSIIFTTHRIASLPSWVGSFREIHDGKLYSIQKMPEKTKRKKNGMPAPQKKPDKPLFELRNVHVFINRQKVLTNINWMICKDENWRIGGGNGSGKSTLLRLLAGDEFVAAGGSLRFYPAEDGKNTTRLADFRKNVCLVSDLSQARYDYDLTGLELICSGLDNSSGLYREFTAEEIAKAWRILHRFAKGDDAEHLAATSIRKLSTGQLRCLFLARGLISQPRLLLLDEACDGLDEKSRVQFLSFLDDATLNGIGGYKPQLVFVSHYKEDAPACINRQAIMINGRLNIAD